MNGAGVFIHIQMLPFPSERDYQIRVPIDYLMIRELIDPLDFPGRDACAIGRMFCTPPPVFEERLQVRSDIAKLVSEIVREHLEEAFGQNDTEMGYKRGERK